MRLDELKTKRKKSPSECNEYEKLRKRKQRQSQTDESHEMAKKQLQKRMEVRRESQSQENHEEAKKREREGKKMKREVQSKNLKETIHCTKLERSLIQQSLEKISLTALDISVILNCLTRAHVHSVELLNGHMKHPASAATMVK